MSLWGPGAPWAFEPLGKFLILSLEYASREEWEFDMRDFQIRLQIRLWLRLPSVIHAMHEMSFTELGRILLVMFDEWTESGRVVLSKMRTFQGGPRCH